MKARTLAALLIVLGFTACGSATVPFPPGPERQRAELSPTEIENIATLLRLEDHRTFEPATLDQLASAPSVEVRRRAATAAGRIGDPSAADLLSRILARDPSPAVRADAAFALGILGDTSAAVIDALRQAAPRDWTPVRAEETTVVVEVVGALGRLGSDAARAAVVDVLRRAWPADDPNTERIAAEALLALWKFPAGPGRTTSALRFLEHPDAELRWRAALALTRMGGTDGLDRLLNRLDDSDARVRALAARALTASAIEEAGIGDAAWRGLTAAVTDPHPHVRTNAVRSLATYGDRAPLDLLADVLRDPDSGVASAAAAALEAVGDAAVPALNAFVADESVPASLRGAGLSALAAVSPAAAASPVAAWAAGDMERRYAAARAAAALGWPAARGVLTELVADADPRVAIAATMAAATMAAEPGDDQQVQDQVRGVLLQAMAAPDPRVRTVALRGLGPILRAEDVPAILDAYALAVEDPAARPAAIEAVVALGSLQARTAGGAAAFFDRFVAPEDRWVRRAVDQHLGERWGQPPAAALADEPEPYRELVTRYVVPALRDAQRPAVDVITPHGEIRIELLAEEAPMAVHNFLVLAEDGFYDNGVWHRVVPNFVLQDGAPAGDPSGGPGWTIRDEVGRVRHDRGIVGMARLGPDTGGSQWYITHSAQPHLDGAYTVFGRVIAGERAMDRVMQGEPIDRVRIRN
jgi:cyclophilin family peptidyl-prolyl cis-trans isomerase/HEAT repeat protein